MAASFSVLGSPLGLPIRKEPAGVSIPSHLTLPPRSSVRVGSRLARFAYSATVSLPSHWGKGFGASLARSAGMIPKSIPVARRAEYVFMVGSSIECRANIVTYCERDADPLPGIYYAAVGVHRENQEPAPNPPHGGDHLRHR